MLIRLSKHVKTINITQLPFLFEIRRDSDSEPVPDNFTILYDSQNQNRLISKGEFFAISPYMGRCQTRLTGAWLLLITGPITITPIMGLAGSRASTHASNVMHYGARII